MVGSGPATSILSLIRIGLPASGPVVPEASIAPRLFQRPSGSIAMTAFSCRSTVWMRVQSAPARCHYGWSTPAAAWIVAPVAMQLDGAAGTAVHPAKQDGHGHCE